MGQVLAGSVGSVPLATSVPSSTPSLSVSVSRGSVPVADPGSKPTSAKSAQTVAIAIGELRVGAELGFLSVGQPVAIGVDRRLARGHAGRVVRIGAVGHLRVVAEAVTIGIGERGIRSRGDLGPVEQPICVAIGVGRIGAERGFLGVAHPILSESASSAGAVGV